MPTVAKATVSPFAAKADELGALMKERELLVAPFKFKQKRLDELSKEFRAACPVADADEWRVSGAHYDILLSPRADWRSVNVKKLVKLIRLNLFAKIATVTLAALEEACEKDVIDAVVTRGPTGPRTLKMIEKSAGC